MIFRARNRSLLQFKVAIVAIILFFAIGDAKAKYVGKFIGKLSELHHGVSGEVYAVDARSLHIKDFTYDGQGPAAYFYAGSSKSPSNAGFRVPDEVGSVGVLKAYRKRSITITLPDGKTLNNIKWFSVWCDEFSVNFGDVKIPANFDYPRPQKIEPLNGVHSISSDNIVIVDAQTLLIPNFSFDGEAPDAKFWVGRGPKPSPDGVRIPNENGDQSPLRPYNRKTIVLTLPAHLTAFDIDYFGVWCEAFTVDFGHIKIPTNLNVPPSLRMLGVSPQSKLNCEVLDDDLAFEVRWAIAGDSIVVQLVCKLDGNEYMSFGVSGDDDHSAMVGGDVVVAWVDRSTLKGFAIDYFLDAKSQCAGTHGSCPDNRLSEKTDSIRLLNAAMVNGYSIVTYQRTLHPADQFDRQIFTNRSQPIIWAVGPLNQRSEVSYHSKFLRQDHLIEFGRTPKWNCPMPDSEKPSSVSSTSSNQPSAAPYIDTNRSRGGNRFKDDAKKSSNLRGSSNRVQTRPLSRNSPTVITTTTTTTTTTTPAPRVVPTPKSVPKQDAWAIPSIECNEPDDGVFYAQLGPTGGKKGYSAITGHVGWGISWYINGLLIPEINVVRGRTYNFVVEAGNNPDIPAKYHPFYITGDPIGGFEHRSREEKSNITIFAGAYQTATGEIVPTGVGRSCYWTPKTDTPAEDFASFGAYQRNLELICDPGEPGLVAWTPDRNTPDTVYYHCFTHRYLGWKINVVDSCDLAGAGSELLPSYSPDDESIDGFRLSPSILSETRVRPNDLYLPIAPFKSMYNFEFLTKPHYYLSGYNSYPYYHQSQYPYYVPDYTPNPYQHHQHHVSQHQHHHHHDDEEFRPSPMISFGAETPEVSTLKSETLTEVHSENVTGTEKESDDMKETVVQLDDQSENVTVDSASLESSPTTITPETSTVLNQEIGSPESNQSSIPNTLTLTQAPFALPIMRNSPFPDHKMKIPPRPPLKMTPPRFMTKPLHSMGPRFGVTLRPPFRPPHVNPNFTMKKPFFRGPFSSPPPSPVGMSTILRPIYQFPPKDFASQKPHFPMKEMPLLMKKPPRARPYHLGHPSLMRPLTPMLSLIPPPNNKISPNLTELIKNEKSINKSSKNQLKLPSIKTKPKPIPLEALVESDEQLTEFEFVKSVAAITTTTPITPASSSSSFTSIIPLARTNPTSESLLPSKMISIKPSFRQKVTTMRPAINTGFHPESVVIEGGFKPIISKPESVIEDRLDDDVDDEGLDSIGVINLTHDDLTHHTNNDYPQQQSTETFEPMFIPSPLDSHSVLASASSSSSSSPASSSINKNNNYIPHFYAPSTYPNKYVQVGDESDEMPMAAERVNSFYLPPPSSPHIPSGTVVSFDGKPVSEVNLSPIKLTENQRIGLSKTEKRLRDTPQFGSYKGELPPSIPELLETVPQVQLQSTLKSQNHDVTKLKLLPKERRRKREAHHTPDHHEHNHNEPNSSSIKRPIFYYCFLASLLLIRF